MGTTEVILGVLLEGPQYGYEVKRRYDEWFPSGRPLAYGQVYAALARLQKDKSVVVVETRVESGPERTVYGLTRRGRERVELWLGEAVADPSPSPGELVRKTVVALATEGDPRPMLARQRAAHLAQMHQVRQAAAVPGLSGLAADHVLQHLDADLRWLDRAIERLDTNLTTSNGGAR